MSVKLFQGLFSFVEIVNNTCSEKNPYPHRSQSRKQMEEPDDWLVDMVD